MNITGKDLVEHGWPQGPAIGAALAYYRNQVEAGDDPSNVWHRLDKVRHHPEFFVDSWCEADVARALVRQLEREQPVLRERPLEYPIWGSELVDDNTIVQMNTAMRMPISLRGALMPDAHKGYGLPVGGVLGTDPNTIIPFAVGVDIGCRMHLSIFDIGDHVLADAAYKTLLKDALIRSTNFGVGSKFKKGRRAEHDVMADPKWEEINLLKGLKATAEEQLGTSGSGNHFVEWGTYTGLDSSKYLAVLSHSGSRGPGSKIADHYTKVAKKLSANLPDEAKELAWLELDHDSGREYWAAMNLAGDYARANHEVIHEKIADVLGASPFYVVDHHHNFAWREIHGGVDMMVHRKGATPAAEGEMGVIPGDTLRPGFVVSGNGNEESLRSASHGAGRTMSRTQAFKSLDAGDWKSILEEEGIDLIGGGLDEATGAYKDINQVVGYQADLVRVVGRFKPAIVRMADSNSRRRY